MKTPVVMSLNGQIVNWEQGVCHFWTETAQRGLNVFDSIRGYYQPEERCLRLIGFAQHLQRLLRSAQMMRIRSPADFEALKHAVCTLLNQTEVQSDMYIRPTIYVEKGGYLLQPAATKSGHYVVMFPVESSRGTPRCVSAVRSSWKRIPDDCFPSAIKCGAAYALTRLARLEAQEKGADEALLFNVQGNLSETPGANVFVVREGVVTTPPTSDGALDGITRHYLTRLLEDEMYIKVNETSISEMDVSASEEIFTCGTLGEVTAVTSYNGSAVGSGGLGPITREVSQRFSRICHGRDTEHRDWYTIYDINNHSFVEAE